MKKLLSILFLAAFALTANAQYQVTNSNFEQWESVSGGVEPVHWSSFLTASGGYASTVNAVQLVKSTDVRPGSTGTNSAKITARKVLGSIIAQGNMTTGQINGGSMSASDASGNYNWTNTSDPDFNMPFTGRPDALRVWIKYYGNNSSHPYGKISAFLHGNGYYQDPNTANTGKLVEKIGEARKGDFTSTNGWVQMTVPFVYSSTNRPSYALVSFSTNVDPGQGTANDYMFIDDMEMLYYSELETATYNGTAITFNGMSATVDANYNEKMLKLKSNGAGATIEKSFNENTFVLTITVKGDNISEDPTNKHTYTINFAGIDTSNGDESNAVVTEGSKTYGTAALSNGSTYLIYNVKQEAFLNNNDQLSDTPEAEWTINTSSGTVKDASGHYFKLDRNGDPTSFNYANYPVTSSSTSWDTGMNFTFTESGGIVHMYRKNMNAYKRGIFNTWQKEDIYAGASSKTSLYACSNSDDIGKWKLYDPTEYWHAYFWNNYASASTSNGVVVKHFITAGQAQTVSGLPLGIYGFEGEAQFYLPYMTDMDVTADQSNKTLTYYGRLDLSLHATYDGVAIQDGSTVDDVYEASKLIVNLTGNGAQSYSAVLDEETYKLTILVSGYGRTNEYEIQFAAPSMTLAAQWYGENIEDGAVINEEYNEQELTLTPGRGTSITRSFDTTTGVLTATQTSVYGETKDYTYKFVIYPEVASSADFTTANRVQTCNGVAYSGTKATITIQTLVNGNINFVFNDFRTNNAASTVINLGTLTAHDIKLDNEGKFSYSGSVRTAQGELVPLTVNGQLVDNTLYAAATVYNDEVLTYYSYNISNSGAPVIVSDDIYVTINGEDAGHKQSTVTVNHLSNGNINFTLNNFELEGIGKIGSIALKNLDYNSETGDFQYTGDLYIAPGSTGSASDWMGPSLGAIPVVMRGQLTGNKMALVIDIDFRKKMDQVIHVSMGCQPTSTKNFTDNLVVTINGASTTKPSVPVTVGYLQNGNINFVLNNFALEGVGAVGNISIENIPFDADNGTFTYDGTTFIGKGSDSSVETWLGPTLGIIPLQMTGQIYTYNGAQYLLATIDIDMQERLKQTIHVSYGATPISTETYTDELVVTINGQSTRKPNTTITVGRLRNGNINFVLNNFTLDGVGGVGNIALDNLALDAEGKFSYSGVTRIGAGTDSSVDWLGPTLGDIPLEMNGQLVTYNKKKYLIAVIDIDMQESIQQTIHVTFGVTPVSTKNYTDDLAVSINGTPADPQTATVTVGTLRNGNINFNLNDFVLGGGAYVGNISIENLELDSEGRFSFSGNTRIAAGSDASKDWLGPTLGDIPLDLRGQFYTYNGEEKLIAVIDIDMTDVELNQMIHVTFGATLVSTESIDGQVSVTVNSEKNDPVPATVTLGTLRNGNLNFVLKNFELGGMKVGNISLDNLELDSDGTFTYNGITRIGAGDMQNVLFEDWLGPQLGNIPLNLTGTLKPNALTVNITIDMRDTELNQMIYVELTGDRIVTSASIEELVQVVLGTKAAGLMYDVTGDNKVTLKDITELVNIKRRQKQ